MLFWTALILLELLISQLAVAALGFSVLRLIRFFRSLLGKPTANLPQS